MDKKGLELNGEPVENIYGWDSGWIQPDKITFLAPWKGYVIKNGGDEEGTAESLSIRPLPHNTPSAKKSAPAVRGHAISISAVSGDFRDGRLELGFNYRDCHDGQDKRDWIKPPMIKNALDISVAVPWRAEPYLTDFRGPMDRGASWDVVVKSGTGDSLYLEFGGLTALPSGIQAVLMDPTTGKSHALRQWRLGLGKRSAAAESLQVAVGNPAYLEERIQAFERKFLPFSLAQNRPNPFRSGTEFSFTLPYAKAPAGGYPVALSLYDVKGRLVRTVLKSKLSPGRHSLYWRRPVSMCPGLYLYRLETGRFKAQSKMLMLR
jgi:hypothetical protein